MRSGLTSFTLLMMGKRKQHSAAFLVGFEHAANLARKLIAINSESEMEGLKFFLNIYQASNIPIPKSLKPTDIALMDHDAPRKRPLYEIEH